MLNFPQQPENCENRNDPDLVQAFLKKWWVEPSEPSTVPWAILNKIYLINMKHNKNSYRW
jgi:hypothetical protein